MTRVAHLVGPGVLRVRNGMPAWEPLQGPPLLLHPECLETLVIHGSADMTAAALRLLWRHGVQLSFLDPRGQRLLGRVSPPSAEAPSLACCQHWAVADPAFALSEARRLVQEKIESLRPLAQQWASAGPAELRSLDSLLANDLRRATSAPSLESLRGHEGAASARWHAAMRLLFPKNLPYPGRVHHPPTDPINAMLSLGYTLLLSRVQAILAALGLDPLIGFYHQPRPAKPALACDLMEPFRAPVVDQMLLAAVRKGTFRPEHFQKTSQGIRLLEEHYRRFLKMFEHRFLSDPPKNPFELQLRRRVEQFAAAVRRWVEAKK